MADPGDFVLDSDGNMAVDSDGHFLVFNAAGECPICCGGPAYCPATTPTHLKTFDDQFTAGYEPGWIGSIAGGPAANGWIVVGGIARQTGNNSLNNLRQTSNFAADTDSQILVRSRLSLPTTGRAGIRVSNLPVPVAVPQTNVEIVAIPGAAIYQIITPNGVVNAAVPPVDGDIVELKLDRTTTGASHDVTSQFTLSVIVNTVTIDTQTVNIDYLCEWSAIMSGPTDGSGYDWFEFDVS